jgi:hypothetical protein
MIIECGSRLTVQTDISEWGVETPPRGSETNLGKILQSRGGHLRLSRDSAMSPLLLSESPSPPGSGRNGTYMAQNAPVCFSHDCAAPGSSNKVCLLLIALRWPNQVWFSEITSLLDGLPWAIPNRRDPLSQGQGTIFHPRPELWNLHVDTTPEGYQLRDSGLSDEVIETILSARTSSTRRIYATKWGVL